MSSMHDAITKLVSFIETLDVELLLRDYKDESDGDFFHFMEDYPSFILNEDQDPPRVFTLPKPYSTSIRALGKVLFEAMSRKHKDTESESVRRVVVDAVR